MREAVQRSTSSEGMDYQVNIVFPATLVILYEIEWPICFQRGMSFLFVILNYAMLFALKKKGTNVKWVTYIQRILFRRSNLYCVSDIMMFFYRALLTRLEILSMWRTRKKVAVIILLTWFALKSYIKERKENRGCTVSGFFVRRQLTTLRLENFFWKRFNTASWGK